MHQLTAEDAGNLRLWSTGINGISLQMTSESLATYNLVLAYTS